MHASGTDSRSFQCNGQSEAAPADDAQLKYSKSHTIGLQLVDEAAEACQGRHAD